MINEAFKPPVEGCFMEVQNVTFSYFFPPRWIFSLPLLHFRSYTTKLWDGLDTTGSCCLYSFLLWLRHEGSSTSLENSMTSLKKVGRLHIHDHQSTWWTVRMAAISAVLTQHESVLSSLEDMAAKPPQGPVAYTTCFWRLLGTIMAQDIHAELECLIIALQLKEPMYI